MCRLLIYTVHKAASTFLHQITSKLSREFSFDYYSIHHDQYYAEIKTGSWREFLKTHSRPGTGFGPIRAGAADPCFPDDLATYTVVLHLRDPRDVLTSLYFSQTYSHPRKEGRFNPTDVQRSAWENQGVDSFVLQMAPLFQRRYQELCTHLLGKSNVVLVKYEDLVLRYQLWLEQIFQPFVEFPVREQTRLGLWRYQKKLVQIQTELYEAHRNDFYCSKEDITQHKRQITPGDHRRKLQTSTIRYLNELFETELKLLGYADENWKTQHGGVSVESSAGNKTHSRPSWGCGAFG
ncbi:MAG: sulfotransferase domain-containing protein [Gemmataceae bacterium]